MLHKKVGNNKIGNTSDYLMRNKIISFSQIDRCTWIRSYGGARTLSDAVNHVKHLWEEWRERGGGVSLRVGNLMPCGWNPEHRVKDCVGWRGKRAQLIHLGKTYLLFWYAFVFVLLFTCCFSLLAMENSSFCNFFFPCPLLRCLSWPWWQWSCLVSWVWLASSWAPSLWSSWLPLWASEWSLLFILRWWVNKARNQLTTWVRGPEHLQLNTYFTFFSDC